MTKKQSTKHYDVIKEGHLETCIVGYCSPECGNPDFMGDVEELEDEKSAVLTELPENTQAALELGNSHNHEEIDMWKADNKSNVTLGDADLAELETRATAFLNGKPRTLSFEDSLLAHLEWKNYNPELNYLVWHGESSYFPLMDTTPIAGMIVGDVSCNCGCGQEHLNLDLYNRLTHARVLAGIPFVINSWNRCKEHNANVGGNETSSHLLGYAVDILITCSEKRFILLKSLLEVGFTCIGIYPWGIHVDNDPEKPDKAIWWGE